MLAAPLNMLMSDIASMLKKIVINRDSKAFGLVKTPLFLVAMIASEASLLAKNPNLAGITKSRNRAISTH